MTIRDVIWNSSDHTRAKLAILKGYLNAWFPIFAQTWPKIVYIDGFAGPGVYAGGEEGSPVVALRAAREHSQRDKFGEIVFWFVEQDGKRHEHLEKVLREKFPDMKNEDGDQFQYHVVHGEFAQSVESTLDEIEVQNQNLAPTFAFVDPFGFSNMPCARSSAYWTISTARYWSRSWTALSTGLVICEKIRSTKSTGRQTGTS